MTNELVHTASKERMALASECVLHNQLLKSAVSITLRLQLCSTCYTAIRMKNFMRSVSAIAMKNTGNKRNSYHHEAVSHYRKLTPCVVSEKNWDTTKVCPVMCVLHIL